MRYPLRPFTATLAVETKAIRGDLRDHTGKLWTFVHGWTYGEVSQRLTAAAFGLGGEIVEWKDA
jgi:hypothetical protein